LLHRPHLPGDAFPGRHVPGAVRHRPHRGMDRAVARDGAGRGAEDRSAAADLSRARSPELPAGGTAAGGRGLAARRAAAARRGADPGCIGYYISAIGGPVQTAAAVVKRGRERAPGATRAAILAAAEELLARGGEGGFSVRELCARTGVTPPTIYHHFGDKG